MIGEWRFAARFRDADDQRAASASNEFEMHKIAPRCGWRGSFTNLEKTAWEAILARSGRLLPGFTVARRRGCPT